MRDVVGVIGERPAPRLLAELEVARVLVRLLVGVYDGPDARDELERAQRRLHRVGVGLVYLPAREA